jgi:hypothetical protein
MSKAYLGAFVAIASVAVGAVDYINQAKAAGSAPGSFAVGAYVGTITGRFADQQTSLQAERVRDELLALPSKTFLPDAPDGWTRGDWTDAVAEQFRKEDKSSGDGKADAAAIAAATNGDPAMAALTAVGKAAAAERDAAQVYVYQKPGAIVAMRVATVAQSAGFGPQSVAMKMAANNIEAMSGKDGFAVVKGVTYRIEKGLFGLQDQERDYRVISGSIGETVQISLRANAEDADIIALLDGIDYDRLNRMLKVPVAGIGSAAPDLAPEESLSLASANVAKAAAAQRAETADQQRRLQLAALDLLLRHKKISQTDYDAAKARLENAASEMGASAGVTTYQEIAVASAAAPASAVEPASGGAGIIGNILGAIGFGGAAPTMPAVPDETPITAPTVKSAVKVNAFGAGSCTKTGAIKRCTIGN